MMRVRYLPVLIDLSQKHVLILFERSPADEAGLGVIQMIRPCTEHLAVLTPSPASFLKQKAEDLHFTLLDKKYAREDLYGADVVICAADDQAVKDDVFAACRTLGIRLCILSEPWRSDFLLEGI